MSTANIFLHSKRMLLVLLILCLVIFNGSVISDSKIGGEGTDAITNLRLACNLSQFNRFSTSENPPLLPTNEREPIPVLVTAIHLKLLTIGRRGFDCRDFLVDGDAARFAKAVNLYWVLIGLIITALLIITFTQNYWLAALGVFLVGYMYFPYRVDTMYTEAAAAAMLLVTSYVMVRFAKTKQLGSLFIVGILCGLLSLTKAIIFYLTLALLGLLLLMIAIQKLQRRQGFTLRYFLVCLLGFAISTTPWLARNKLTLDEFSLTKRGGNVLYARSVKNQMKDNEIFGAYYLWGPLFYQITVNRLGGAVSEKDFQRGGRFARINRYESDFSSADWNAALSGHPEQAISLRQKAKAEYYRQLGNAKQMGMDQMDSTHYADRQLSKLAWSNIRQNPIRHLAMSTLFAWRGIWSYSNDSIHFGTHPAYILIKDFIAFFSYLSLIALFIGGIIRRNLMLICLTVLPVGVVVIYALMTHNIPRYSSIASPLMIVSSIILVNISMRGFTNCRRKN